MFNLHLPSSFITNIGFIMIYGISFIIVAIIMLLFRMFYLKRKLKQQLAELNKVNHLSLSRRKLINPSLLRLSLSGSLAKQLNHYCLRNRITKSFYLENLISQSLKGGKFYG